MAAQTRAELWATRLVWAGLLGFAALAVVSMRYYPGGNLFEPHPDGHRFWLNFWCDLLKPQLDSGAPNAVGARFGMASFVALTVGVLPFYWLAQRAEAQSRARRAALFALGTLASAGLIAVLSSRSLGSALLHWGGILVGAPAGLLAVTLVLGAQLRRTSPTSVRRLGALGAFGLGLSWLNLGLYCRELLSDGAPWVALPIVQKGATVVLLAWVALTAPTLRRGTRLPIAATPHTGLHPER